MAERWFSVHQTELAAALAHVQRAVDGKREIPILSHMLLKAEGSTLTVRGTNLDLQIQASCELLSEGAGAFIALPAARLNDIVRQLPESVEIIFEAGRMLHQVGIRAGRSAFSLPFLQGADFPEMRGRQDFDWTEIDGAALAKAIDKSIYAASKTDARHFLKGLCLHHDRHGAGLVIAGTDGLTLARVVMPGAGAPTLPKPEKESFPHIILPHAALSALSKLLDDAKEPAEMAATESMAAFRLKGVEIATKIVDGVYPLYEKVIPERTGKTIVVPQADFARAVRRVCSIVEDQRGDGIRLRVGSDQVALDLLNSEGAHASDSVPAVVSDCEDFTIATSAAAMLKTISALQSVDLELTFTDDRTAIRFSPVGRDDETFLISPMQPRYVLREATNEKA